MVRCVLSNPTGNLSQNISPSPIMQKHMNAATPKISKNRLLGDFCFLLLLFDNIISVILVPAQIVPVRYIVHVQGGHSVYPAST
jgi:hypothetical protein